MSEITVQVVEGEPKQFTGEATVADAIAELLSNKQRKQTVAAGVGDNLVDLSVRLDSLGLETVELRPVTISSDEGLDILRHSTAHLMAKAVLDLYGPDLKVAIGPSIADGFYYDFDRETPFTPDDFEAIEAKMLETARSGLPFEREVVSKTDAIELFEKKGEQYKVELLKEIEGDTVSLYQLGDFVDLCRGPHVPNSSLLQVYKLIKVAGAYWRGDERNSMLQRLYGTAFADKKKLKKYLNDLEEAKKRDHRKLGKELGLFTISEQVGPGLILWQPKGALLRKLIEDYWKDEHYKHDYELLYTPHIAKLDMWKTSGHLDFYNENMFSSMVIDEVQYQLKPMNCPFHIEIYKSQMRSYREFPIRWCELGTVYRYERTGVLHGLMRVRGFTQDDAHIFCRPDQLEDEIFNILDLNLNILETFGFDQYEIYLSTRPEKYVGSEEHWQKSTDALKQALEKRGLEYQLDPGEGVFYGPKIDVKIKDILGRSWQCSTIQVDFNLPERFEVCYIGEDGKEHQPIMIHRALMGSLERFIGVLIENYAGAFPVWLAPVQARIMNITDVQGEYCEKVYQELRQSGIRIEKDLRNEKLNYKIREAQLAKIPYMLVIGDREVESGTVTVRERSGKNLPPMSVEDFATKIKDECKVVLG
jgi:threonyl-tRNA synthetase